MKDKRVAARRGALESLLESLDATVRIVRWNGAEHVPEPLQAAAEQVGDRLGRAKRAFSEKFFGAPVLVTAIKKMGDAVGRLEVAYDAYHARVEASPSQREDAASALDQEIGEVRADAHEWA